MIIRFAHVGEAWAQGSIIRANKRIVSHEVNMVFNKHHISYREIGIQPATGIGQDEDAYAKFLEYPYGKGNLLHAVAFIKVKSPLQGNNFFTTELAEDELSLMPLHC